MLELTIAGTIELGKHAPSLRNNAWPLLARTGGRKSGGACLLRPGVSDVDLFRYCQGVIDFDAQISDGAFDLCMPEQKLDGPEISRAPIDQGRFGASQ
jgi:hypothetical protein